MIRGIFPPSLLQAQRDGSRHQAQGHVMMPACPSAGLIFVHHHVALTERLKLNPETFRTKFVELERRFGDASSPNLVEILSGGALSPCTIGAEGAQLQHSPKIATHFMHSKSAPLSNLIYFIYVAHKHGVTGSTAALDRYIFKHDPNASGEVIPK